MKTMSRFFVPLFLPLLLLIACNAKDSAAPPASMTVAPARPLALVPFEGIMYMTTTIPGEAKSDMKLFIGRQGVRTESSMDGEGPQGKMQTTVISRADTPHKVYMIDDAAGTCMEVDISRAKGKEVDSDPFSDAKIENLGNETVNGYNCTHVRITRPGKTEIIELWVTREMLDYSTYVRMQASRDRSMPKLAERLKAAGLDGFPVRILLTPSGIVTDLTKVERSTLDDRLFEVPANCTKLTVPAIGPDGMSKEKLREMEEFTRKMQQQQK